MKTIRAFPELTDDQCDELKGKYLDDSHYSFVVSGDCDCYDAETGDLLFRFRKNPFTEDLLKTGWDNCKHLAKASRGRGASAGPIDPEAVYWKKRKIYWQNKWSAKYIVKDKKTGEEKESSMKVNNEVASNPIGFYGKTKGLGCDLPCRLTHYTKQNMNNYAESQIYFQKISDMYRDLLPEKYNEQRERALKNEYHIPGTAFSTITINRNFRTAVHQDKGDFGGWASLTVLEENKYHGGLFVLPKYDIAIDMRHGDYLLCDVHQYHGNTELYETEEDKEYNDKYPQETYKDNLEVGVLGLNNRFTRLSFVCYLREDLIKCSKPLAKFVISLEGSERLPQWSNTDFIHWRGVNGKKDLSYDSEECKKMVSYHNIKETPQHLAKTGCFMSHLNLLKHIVDQKINNVLIVEDDALLVNKLPEDLPQDCLTYLGGFICNKKITSKEKISIDHKTGINELDTDKYRMLMTLSYYIPKWEIAEEILQEIMKLKRYRAIDIVYGNVIKKVKYIYPSPFIEEYWDSQICNNKKTKSCNEFYEWI
tara:strand:+ start:2887 stop:4494 length:1608 start_codon:yes stop_codon:yes gene_type:complete